jgi:hypothetical protein
MAEHTELAAPLCVKINETLARHKFGANFGIEAFECNTFANRRNSNVTSA